MGIGTAMLVNLKEQVKKETRPDTSLVLLAVPDTEQFYERLGFSPVEASNTGMRLAA
jgi:hypothetical protein